MTTWRELIGAHLADQGEDWASVVESTLDEAHLDVEFNDGYGGSEGVAFTLWTGKRVYFPVVYDGAEWVASVARNPDGVATWHVGGQ